jgi:hypothetical protein
VQPRGTAYRRTEWQQTVKVIANAGAFTGIDRGRLRSALGPWKNTVPWHSGPAAKVRILGSKIFNYSGIAVAFKTTFEVFARVGPDNSLERLTERSVGLVTDQPSNVYELFVTLFQ